MGEGYTPLRPRAILLKFHHTRLFVRIFHRPVCRPHFHRTIDRPIFIILSMIHCPIYRPIHRLLPIVCGCFDRLRNIARSIVHRPWVSQQGDEHRPIHRPSSAGYANSTGGGNDD